MVSKLRLRLDKLRLTLAILLLGFVIDGTFEAYTYINHNYPLPYASSVFIIGPFVTLAGLLPSGSAAQIGINLSVGDSDSLRRRLASTSLPLCWPSLLWSGTVSGRTHRFPGG